MFVKIDAPAFDDVELYDEVALARRGNNRIVMQRYKRDVLSAYNSYANTAPWIETLLTLDLDDVEADVFIGAYDNSLQCLEPLKEFLWRQPNILHCPYCGLATEATHLDHYAPKSIYPEFSIYSKNLVPSCSYCNVELKRVNFLSAGQRMFLHPYFDEINERVRLHCEIILEETAVATRYRIERIDAELRLFNVVQVHFNELRLGDRFSDSANDELNNDKENITYFYDDGGFAGVIAYFTSEYDRELRRKGANNWRTSLFNALRNLSNDNVVMLVNWATS